jgi:hypothetical protein
LQQPIAQAEENHAVAPKQSDQAHQWESTYSQEKVDKVDLELSPSDVCALAPVESLRQKLIKLGLSEIAYPWRDLADLSDKELLFFLENLFERCHALKITQAETKANKKEKGKKDLRVTRRPNRRKPRLINL